ncbi:hypothetical protein CBOM_00549 [Ceraceosorus bombacis]|uniref:Uncharacterized protein n=1 Tax=Ceraceosorus bombacis TaxID=401625 RepID=A0A0P1B9C6_9BASI|nr:hypothetical protein CBOM_00549 [Ceraceosorus bombacis]
MPPSKSFKSKVLDRLASQQAALSHSRASSLATKSDLAANTKEVHGSTNKDSSSQRKETPLSLPQLISLLSSCSLSQSGAGVSSIQLAGQLVRARLNTEQKLRHIDEADLENAGVQGVELKKRILKGLRKALRDGPLPAFSSTNQSAAAPTSSAKSVESFDFAPVLVEQALTTRRVHVNRAPVLLAWAVVLCERLGFTRCEALSVAQCYVSITAQARGQSIGVIRKSSASTSGADASDRVGNNQPHFVLMGVKIPLMRISVVEQSPGQQELSEWRAILDGSVVEPSKAFNYLRAAMRQLLPHVIGALTLLADSYMVPPPGATEAHGVDELHKRAFELYVDFRPETGGEWGKKGTLFLSAILRLKKGSQESKGKPDENGMTEEDWRREAARLGWEEQSKQTATDHAIEGPVKSEIGVQEGPTFSVLPANAHTPVKLEPRNDEASKAPQTGRVADHGAVEPAWSAQDSLAPTQDLPPNPTHGESDIVDELLVEDGPGEQLNAASGGGVQKQPKRAFLQTDSSEGCEDDNYITPDSNRKRVKRETEG